MINSGDAAERNIANGDRGVLRTKRGGVEMYVYVTDDIVPGAIEAGVMGTAAPRPTTPPLRERFFPAAANAMSSPLPLSTLLF